MIKTVEKEMSVAECYRTFLWYIDQLEKEKNGADNILKHLSNLFQWKLRRNIATIQDVAIDFEKYRQSMKKNFDEKWLDKEKSQYISEGKIKVKDEYLEEYKVDLQKLIDCVTSVLNEKSVYQITVMDVEAEVENIINDLENPDFNEIEILFFMDQSST